MTQEKGTNKAIRRENRNRIFRYVCKNGRASNPVIAQELKLSLPTVLQNTKELKEMGVLRDAGVLESTGGRKAKTVDVVGNFRCSVGMEITRNHIVIVLTNLIGENLDWDRIFIPFRDEEEYYLKIQDLLGAFVKRNQVEKERILGVGISIPGIVNDGRRMLDRSHVLGLKDYPLDRIAGFIPYKTWFMNDANAGAFAEGFYAPEEDHFFYLSLNDTVGGGFCDRKRLLAGDHFRSGEVGHMILFPGGKKCYCGQKGCSDSYCSALRLSELENGDLESFFDCLKKGNKRETLLWQEYVHDLALLIHNIHVTLDSDIVIGGYVGSAMGGFIEDIGKEVRKIDLFGQDVSYLRPCAFRISESAFGAALYEVQAFISQI